MNLTDEEKDEIASKVAACLEAKREKRISLTIEEVRDLKKFVDIKNSTIKGLIWVGAILAAVAIKDIWGLVWERLKHLF